MSAYPKIWFKYGNDPRDELEANQRGCCDDIRVELQDGRQFELVVYDTTRLVQDIDRLAECGQMYFAEPTMIVVPEVTTENINKTVRALLAVGYFDRILPLG